MCLSPGRAWTKSYITGIGAHTDFGAITMLLQDDAGGLQVWNNGSSEWVDVRPVLRAYVVNLGNMMMRWTNDRLASPAVESYAGETIIFKNLASTCQRKGVEKRVKGYAMARCARWECKGYALKVDQG